MYSFPNSSSKVIHTVIWYHLPVVQQNVVKWNYHTLQTCVMNCLCLNHTYTLWGWAIFRPKLELTLPMVSINTSAACLESLWVPAKNKSIFLAPRELDITHPLLIFRDQLASTGEYLSYILPINRNRWVRTHLRSIWGLFTWSIFMAIFAGGSTLPLACCNLSLNCKSTKCCIQMLMNDMYENESTTI